MTTDRGQKDGTSRDGRVSSCVPGHPMRAHSGPGREWMSRRRPASHIAHFQLLIYVCVSTLLGSGQPFLSYQTSNSRHFYHHECQVSAACTEFCDVGRSVDRVPSVFLV